MYSFQVQLPRKFLVSLTNKTMPSFCFLEATEISKKNVYLKYISVDFRL